jgi:hypothetical protein
MNTALNGTSSRHNPEQERVLQERTKVSQGQIRQNMLRGCTDRYLDVGNNPNQQCASHKKGPQNGNCVDISKIDGQRWLSCQKSESGAIYITFNDDIKIQEGDLSANHVREVQQQVPSHPLTKQQVDRPYGRCMQTHPTAGTLDNSEPSAASQIITQNIRYIGSSGDDAANNVEQHLRPHKQHAYDVLLSQDVISTEEVTRETQEMKPVSLQNSVNQLPQCLLEDYADFITEFLLQSDFDNDILAFEAVLELGKF